MTLLFNIALLYLQRELVKKRKMKQRIGKIEKSQKKVTNIVLDLGELQQRKMIKKMLLH